MRGQDGKEMLLVPEGWFTMGSTEAEIKAAYELSKKYDANTLEPGLRMKNPSTGCG